MTVVKSNVQLIGPELFADIALKAFAVLDGASVPGLLPLLHRCNPEHECLYRGDLEPDIAEVAPYLIQLEPDTEFTDVLLNQGWGKHWGVFALTAADLFAMRQHLRRYLTVHDSAGKPLLFRYYDPRVLSVFLPTCNAEELTAFFGPVSTYFMEIDEPGSSLSFRLKSGELVKKKKHLADGSAAK